MNRGQKSPVLVKIKTCSRGLSSRVRYITTFKYIHGLVDHNFNILRNSDIHSYNTRRRNDFRFPFAKRNYGDFLINALRNGTF